MSDRPVKFGSICATCLPMMLWNEYYENEREMVMDIAIALNEDDVASGVTNGDIDAVCHLDHLAPKLRRLRQQLLAP